MRKQQKELQALPFGNQISKNRKEITKEQVLKAPPVTEPLGLYDCCPTTDGAAALILCKAELAEKRFSKTWLNDEATIYCCSSHALCGPALDYR